MGYKYASTVSGFPEDPDELFVTRCEEGHLQLVIRSRSHTGMVCVKPEDVAEVTAEMQGYARVAEASAR